MINPILRIRHAIQRRRLDIYIRVAGIEIHVSDRGRLVRERGSDGYAFEIWRGDEIYVLAGVGEETHHREGNEGAHGAAIVISGQAAVGGLEVGGDVEVRAEGRESGASGVVVLEDGEKGGLITDVGDLLVVQVVKSGDEC